jgi:hypothetical protein
MKKKLTVLVAMLAMMLFAAAPAFADTALVNIGPLNAEGEGVISAEAESACSSISTTSKRFFVWRGWANRPRFVSGDRELPEGGLSTRLRGVERRLGS